MKKYFITGTDTNVGKTLVSSILALALKGCYWKPIESGTDDAPAERKQVQQWTDLAEKVLLPPVYSFGPSLTPSHVANKAGLAPLELEKCILPSSTSPLIVEGVAGVFAPLNETQFTIDMIQQFNLPTIIVSRGTLGTINHTLLTIEALRKRNIAIKGIVYSGELNPDNQVTIEKFSQVKTLFHVPYFKEITPTVLKTWISQNQTSLGVL